MKITKLTSEQENQLDDFREKWLNVGLNCEPCDFEKAKKAVSLYYKSAGLALPKLFLLTDSPLSGLLMLFIIQKLSQNHKQIGDQIGNQVWNQIRDQIGNQVWNQVGNQVWDQIWGQIGNQVRNQIGNQVWNQIRNQVRDQVWDQIGNQVRNQVWNQIGNQVRNQIGNQIRDQIWDQIWDQIGNQIGGQVDSYCFGSHDASWLGFYDFFREVCNLKKETTSIIGLIELASYCGWWLPYEEIVILQHRHSEVHLNSNNQLHKDGGPAILYRDGFAIWALNGIRVTQEIAETPADRLEPKKLFEIENIDMRREVLRKIGIDRAIPALQAKILDKQGDYELVLLCLDEGLFRPFLKMLNPSIKTWHIEGVSPECRTVSQALNWRNGTNEQPLILT